MKQEDAKGFNSVSGENLIVSERITPEELSKSSLDRFNSNIKKTKIVCNVWLLGKDGSRDKFIGSKKVKVGATNFVVKNKRYWIDYNSPALKEGKKFFTYDCDVTNAIGGLGFRDVADKADTADGKIKPNQADMMLVDGVVKVLMGKGGIPALYLLVAFVVVGIALAGLMYFLSQYQTLTKQVETFRESNLKLTESNEALEAYITQLESQLPDMPTGGQ